MNKEQKKWKTKAELKQEIDEIGGIDIFFRDIVGYSGQSLATTKYAFVNSLNKKPELSDPKLETIIRLFKKNKNLASENKELKNQNQVLQKMLADYMQDNRKN